MRNVDVQAAVREGASKKAEELNLTHEWMLRWLARLWRGAYRLSSPCSNSSATVVRPSRSGTLSRISLR